jgi:hypothetical protein
MPLPALPRLCLVAPADGGDEEGRKEEVWGTLESPRGFFFFSKQILSSLSIVFFFTFAIPFPDLA